MLARCKPDSPDRPIYYDRGIQVAERWTRFEAFFADMGPKPSASHSIDRIDNDGNYEPGNCRWAVAIVQANNKRNNFMVEYRGHRMTIHQAWRQAGEVVGFGTVNMRLRRGWPVVAAVEIEAVPVYGKRETGSHVWAA